MNEMDQELADQESTSLSFPRMSKDDIGWLLVGGGVVSSLVTLLRGQRRVTEWALPISLVGIGCSVLLKRRQGRIDSAEELIRAELDSLDPIARAQVLKSVAKGEIGRLPGLGDSD